MLSIYVYAASAIRAWRYSWGHRGERGQASAEYALVLLGAAAIALLVGAWALKTDLVAKLLGTVLDNITGSARETKTRP